MNKSNSSEEKELPLYKETEVRVPIHLKITLTIREAAEYSNIGINKIDSMLKQPNCPFVLYVGTPCQIAGLKSFLGKDYDNLLAVDLICFCVTPVTAFRKYLDEKYGLGEIENVVFRDKYKGWSCDGYTIHKKDGSILYLGIDTDEY